MDSLLFHVFPWFCQEILGELSAAHLGMVRVQHVSPTGVLKFQSSQVKQELQSPRFLLETNERKHRQTNEQVTYSVV